MKSMTADRPQGSAADWNEQAGHVSRAFDSWRLVDRDIRTFLKLATTWATQKYDDLWDEVERDADGTIEVGAYDVGPFEQEVEGLWPDDYQWMLRAAVVRDAVTAFEVYLEKSLDEALARRLRVRVKRPAGESPRWKTLVEGHELLGNEIATERIRHIRALRHMLTHQRGELRTEEIRKKFVADYLLATDVDTGEELWHRAYVGGRVQLHPDTVNSILDDLEAAVRKADSRVWAVAWANAPAPELDELRKTMKDGAGD
jgi:hypothetical protein